MKIISETPHKIFECPVHGCLTGLFLLDGAPHHVELDEVSVEVQVVQSADVSTVEATSEHFAVILTGDHRYRPLRTEVLRFRTDLDELERISGNLVWGDTRATFEIKELYQGAVEEYREALEGFEALEELESLKALEGLDGLWFEILDRDEEEDKRRRRRRRRPREEAPDGSGN